MITETQLAPDQIVTFVDAVDADTQPRENTRIATIDRELRFSLDGLRNYFAKWDPRLYDLLVIAAAFDFCDLTTHRPALRWTRRFDLRLAVHEVRFWSSPEVKGALEDAIKFLTGDVWKLSFVRRRKAVDEIENPGLGLEGSANVIMPYSDGLDSRAVAALESANTRNMLRVRLGREGRDQQQPGRRTEPFMAVPYEIRVGKRDRRESTARSRGFKFAVVTGIAACLASINTIIVTESGQGALGPALAVAGQAYPDYRVHPAFSRKMERLFAAVTGHNLRYLYPRLWKTKAETLAEALKLPIPPSLIDTRSCWQQSRQVGVNGRRRQCGICAACLLRRMSLHAAKVKEPNDAYVWENLSSPDFHGGAVSGFKHETKALEAYAVAGVLHLDHLAALPSSALYDRLLKRNARQIAAAMGEDGVTIESNLRDLLLRHREEWHDFLKFLGPKSFVSKFAFQVS